MRAPSAQSSRARLTQEPRLGILWPSPRRGGQKQTHLTAATPSIVFAAGRQMDACYRGPGISVRGGFAGTMWLR